MWISYLKKVVRIMVGLTIFAFGVYMMIYASIGIAPWDVLGMGISEHTPLNYGMSMTSVSVIILFADIALKEPVGIGMICDALYTGNMAQFFTDINLLPAPGNLFVSILYLVGGITVCCYGQYFYMSAGLTCGPRDTFTVGVGKRVRKLSIGIVQNLILVVVFCVGWALGGPVGIGTVIVVLGYGSIMNLVFRIVKFEPRDVHHENLMETIRKLRRSSAE